MDITDVRRDVLYRGVPTAPEVRSDESPAGSLMFGHFAVFDQWTEIHSWYEGDFLETIAPGAFTKTITENRDTIRVQFDHGFDSFVGSSPLGPLQLLEEDDIGAAYEVPLLDTDYNRNRVLPMLQGRTIDGRCLGSVLGASFRFRVIKDEWEFDPKRSNHNPERLPERTIREIRMFELGPVVFQAYQNADAGVRSLTDHFLERSRETRSVQRPAQPPAGPTTTEEEAPAEPAHRHSTDPHQQRQLLLTKIEKAKALSCDT